jgi:hypothetical protein
VPTDADVAAVAAAGARLDLPAWEPPPPCTGLALAVIEAVWSIGVRAESVAKVVERYTAARDGDGADAARDTPGELVDFIDDLGGGEAFAEHMRNRQRTSTRGGILKAEAVLLEARMLVEEGVREPADLPAKDEERLAHLSARWGEVPGQRSLVSWHAFLMGLGRPEVKPDRMIRRFVAEVLGRPGEEAVGADEARLLVRRAAERLGQDARLLDFAIWSHQRARGVRS